MQTEIDDYFTDGCLRCPLGGTPKCKVNDWKKELESLRCIILDCGLTEQIKWGVPCYTFKKGNVLVLAAFKEYCSVSFFKGVLLHNDAGLLESPGENTQSARLIPFRSIQEILEKKAILKTYIFEAIEVEKAGLKVEFKKNPQPVPEELQMKLNTDNLFKIAFEALTPGRQRGYILYFSAPKQSKTRISRVEKYRQQILDGRGLHEK